MGIWAYVLPYPYFVYNNNDESSNGYRPRTPTTVPISSIVNEKKKFILFPNFIEIFLFVYRTSAYQHYSYSSHSHYPQAAYAAHYPYAPQSTATAGTAATTATTTTAATTTQPQASSSSQQRMDAAGSDITTLNDALGSAGVDLRVSSLSSLSLNLFLNNHTLLLLLLLTG